MDIMRRPLGARVSTPWLRALFWILPRFDIFSTDDSCACCRSLCVTALFVFRRCLTSLGLPTVQVACHFVVAPSLLDFTLACQFVLACQFNGRSFCFSSCIFLRQGSHVIPAQSSFRKWLQLRPSPQSSLHGAAFLSSRTR